MDLIAAVLWFFGCAVTQDADPGECDFQINIGASEHYYINNTNYPSNYNAGGSCRFIVVCPVGYNCRLDCDLVMPVSTGCTADRLLISRSGDPTLTGAAAYCGTRTVSAVSLDRTISMGHSAATNSRGGRYNGTVSAQLAATVTQSDIACRCGEKKQNRIVGGQETGVNEYTMMAGLVDAVTKSLGCGGVIISKKHIMTAANCLTYYRPSPNILLVLVGEHDITDNIGGTIYAIERLIIHENYNPITIDNDIGLVVVNEEIQFNENVQPVCLPFKFLNTDLTGRNVTMLGWGTTSFGGPRSDVLRKVDETVTSQAYCSATHSSITSRQICTFAQGKDVCQYDTGGLVLLLDSDTGLEFCVGIISYGIGCSGTVPSVNTRVTEHLTWISNRANTSFCVK